LDYTALRFANVYGPRQFKGGEAGVVSIFVDNAVVGKTSTQNGDGLQTRDFVYIDDVVESLSVASTVTYPGEINIASGIESSLLDIRGAISAAMGHEIDVREAPAKPGEQRRSCLDASLAKKVLRWEPKVVLTEGIRRTIAWTKTKHGNF